MEDGTKSTDSENRHLFKFPKVTSEDGDEHPAPKRAGSSWQFFNSEKVKELYAAGNGKNAFSVSSEAWKQMDEEEKAPYEKKSQDDKARFNDQVAELSKHGYFTLADGSKTTDS